MIYLKHRSNFLFISLIILLGYFQSAQAHDVFSGQTEARIDAQAQLTLEMKFAAVSVEGMVTGIYDRDNQVSARNLPNIRDFLIQKAMHFYVVTVDGTALSQPQIDVRVVNEEDAVFFTLRYNQPVLGKLGFKGEFIKLTNPEYKSTLKILNPSDVQLGLFIQSPDDNYNEILVTADMLKLSAQAKPQTDGVFKRFLLEGIHHILIGYDHILFLLALLLVCRSWKPALAVITCFTLAHTLTLSLAALQIVTLPSILVEVVIALSIVYVGVENLLSKHRPKMRWILTAVFGLVHGLGFASALRGIGLGTDGAPIILPLFSFNLGVEIGQLALAAVTLPLLWYLHKYAQFERRVLPLLSSVVVIMGGYWAIARLWGYFA